MLGIEVFFKYHVQIREMSRAPVPTANTKAAATMPIWPMWPTAPTPPYNSTEFGYLEDSRSDVIMDKKVFNLFTSGGIMVNIDSAEIKEAFAKGAKFLNRRYADSKKKTVAFMKWVTAKPDGYAVSVSSQETLRFARAVADKKVSEKDRMRFIKDMAELAASALVTEDGIKEVPFLFVSDEIVNTFNAGLTDAIVTTVAGGAPQ